MSKRFYEISAAWMKACGKGDQAKVVEVLQASNNHPTMTALTVDMGGYEWTVIAEWRGRFVEAPPAPVMDVVTDLVAESALAQGDEPFALDFVKAGECYEASGAANFYSMRAAYDPANGYLVTLSVNGFTQGTYLGFDEAVERAEEIEDADVAGFEAEAALPPVKECPSQESPVEAMRRTLDFHLNQMAACDAEGRLADGSYHWQAAAEARAELDRLQR